MQRARVTDMQDRLIDLLVQYDEASKDEDWQRMRSLLTDIDDARKQRDEIRCRDAAE